MQTVAWTLKGFSVPAGNGLKTLQTFRPECSGLLQGDDDQCILVEASARFSAHFQLVQKNLLLYPSDSLTISLCTISCINVHICIYKDVCLYEQQKRSRATHVAIIKI